MRYIKGVIKTIANLKEKYSKNKKIEKHTNHAKIYVRNF